MADIFLSYASQDRARVQILADELVSEGFTVWWDTSGLSTGDAWRSKIEKELIDARFVVVCWSRASMDSRWVLQEAEEARRLGKLRPVSINPRLEPPFGFRDLQTLDLSGWLSNRGHPAFKNLVQALGRTPRVEKTGMFPRAPVSDGPKELSKPAEPRADSESNSGFSFAGSATLVVVLIIGWSLFGPKEKHSESDASKSAISQVFGKASQSGAGASQQPATVEPAKPAPILYKKCPARFSLECLNPDVRRAVEEARQHAAEADAIRGAALEAQAQAQDAARRARLGESLYEIDAGNERDTFALFEGRTSYSRGNVGILRARPASGVDRYEGQVKYSGRGRVPHGLGVMIYQDGIKFLGNFADGVANGLGVTDRKGSTSSGLVVNGVFSSGVSRDEIGPFREGSATLGVEWSKNGQIERAGRFSGSQLVVPLP